MSNLHTCSDTCPCQHGDAPPPDSEGFATTPRPDRFAPGTRVWYQSPNDPTEHPATVTGRIHTVRGQRIGIELDAAPPGRQRRRFVTAWRLTITAPAARDAEERRYRIARRGLEGFDCEGADDE